MPLGKENPYIYSKVNPLNTDTLLIRTPHYYGQFALPLGKENPYIYSKVNPLNTDTLLIRTPHYYEHFALSLGKESPYISFKFNPHNTDTCRQKWVSGHLIVVAAKGGRGGRAGGRM